MASAHEILSAANKLGTLVASSPEVASYRSLTRQLDLDISARQLVEQFEGLMEQLAAKEANMQPIEIGEKQRLQSLQQSIAIHPLLKKLMTAQMEYSDLMRKVQEAINGGMTGQPPSAGGQLDQNAEAQPTASASKLIIPG